jgi:diacylglycerol kinase family enzyme
MSTHTRPQLKPIFDRALVDVTVVQTTHAGHAKEFMTTVDISQFDGFATVSGDGLLHEALNGLMARPDWQDALKKPLGGACASMCVCVCACVLCVCVCVCVCVRVCVR